DRAQVAPIADPLPRGSGALDPSVDVRPPGIATRRLSDRQTRRNRKRQQRRQFWKPTVLLFHLHRIIGGARQARDHALAQAKGSVVPPADSGGSNRKVRALRKLSGHHAMHERGVYDRLLYVHLVSSAEAGDTRTFRGRS